MGDPVMQFAVWRLTPTIGATVLLCLFTLVVSAPLAQEITREIEDFSDSLDSPFVPSAHSVLNSMFDLTKPTEDDFLIDLGSGDGRIVITAAKVFGTPGYGVDLNEGLVKIANARAAEAGVADRVKFYVRNLFEEDFSRASVLTMYLLPEVLSKIRPKLFADLRPGSRIVSHDYHLGDWRPDATRLVYVEGQGHDSIVYYWVVPAKVSGTWKLTSDYVKHFREPLEYRVEINQRFQDIDGQVELFERTFRIHEGNISGDLIVFSATGEIDEPMVRQDFAGVVNGNTITGSVRLSGGVHGINVPWKASRVSAGE